MDLTSLNPALLETIKTHIAMGLHQGNGDEDIYAAQLRLQAIEGELTELIRLESLDGNQGNYDVQLERLLNEKISLMGKLEAARAEERHGDNEQALQEEFSAELNRLRHCPVAWDDVAVRQMVECVRVLSKDRLRVSFRIGGEMEVMMV